MSIWIKTDKENVDWNEVADHVMFAGDEEQQTWLEEEGFLLPDGYRFGDNEYERRAKE